MSEMRAATIGDIKIAAENAKGICDKMSGHWSGGRYEPNSIDLADYHIGILEDGKYLIRDDFTEKLAHTWHRNTGNIGIAFFACFGATSNDLGQYAPTDVQINSMALAVRVVCDALEQSVNDTFKTHAEWADLDGYGPATTCERWDLAILRNGDAWMSGGDQIRKLAAEVAT